MSKLENVEAIVIKFLSDNQDFAVFADKPKNPPKQYILVEREGGGREYLGVLDMASIRIAVYSKNSRLEASEQANVVADMIHKIAEEYDDVTRSKVNSVVQLDDTLTQTWRYEVFADVYHRR